MQNEIFDRSIWIVLLFLHWQQNRHPYRQLAGASCQQIYWHLWYSEYGWVSFKMFVSFLIIQHFLFVYNCGDVTFVSLGVGSFFNCCNAVCSFFVKIDLFHLLFHVVESTLPQIRSASLGKMPRNPSWTEARISFTGTSLGAIAKFWADTDAFYFSLMITDADVFASLKLHLKGITVHFVLHGGHINNWNSCTSYKRKTIL